MSSPGKYPPEYNPKVHGAYDPGRYYGKADLHISEVKLGELGSWFSRRSYSPQSMVSAVGRTYWRWADRYLNPKRAGLAAVCHVTLSMSLAYYFLQYKAHKNHRHAKYH
ncbi:hypothetical protein SNE40_020273 [Patella caerulea]|uniref:ATP synthase subunit f, mitochondrial n=1 Tax=Patella caerulea TaxID=87958 RepID=A0AAN8J166_PATCE